LIINGKFTFQVMDGYKNNMSQELKLLSLEKVYEILGTSKLSGDKELLREVMTDTIRRNGEEWVRNHQKLCIDQWESL
jgi:hypothetical protein